MIFFVLEFCIRKYIKKFTSSVPVGLLHPQSAPKMGKCWVYGTATEELLKGNVDGTKQI